VIRPQARATERGDDRAGEATLALEQRDQQADDRRDERPAGDRADALAGDGQSGAERHVLAAKGTVGGRGQADAEVGADERGEVEAEGDQDPAGDLIAGVKQVEARAGDRGDGDQREQPSDERVRGQARPLAQQAPALLGQVPASSKASHGSPRWRQASHG
jgi:hypothetical protein